jgi:tetratricopeptide (TPR) repeat protein
VGDPVGEEWYSKSLEAAQSIGDERHIASVLHRLAVWRIHYEDYDGAIRLMEESESLSEALGLDRVLASNLSLRGTIARRRGDLNAALRYSDESREIAHRTGFTWWERVEWQARAVALFGLGRPAEAAESGLEAARIAERMGDRASTVHSLALVARGCAERGDVVAAGRIWGAIEAEQERAPIPAWGVERKELWEPVLAHDGPDFAAGRAAGRTATLVEILEELRSLD